jgi:hypothetical protein
MKRQDTGKSQRVRRRGTQVPGHGADQDTTAAWAAVAAWAADAHADRDWPEISAPGIVLPGVPKPRLPGVGPLPGP